MPRQAKKIEYPRQTRGGKLAAKVRKSANSLSAIKRERLCNKGMAMIYGGQIPAKAPHSR